MYQLVTLVKITKYGMQERVSIVSSEYSLHPQLRNLHVKKLRQDVALGALRNRPEPPEKPSKPLKPTAKGRLLLKNWLRNYATCQNPGFLMVDEECRKGS